MADYNLTPTLWSDVIPTDAVTYAHRHDLNSFADLASNYLASALLNGYTSSGFSTLVSMNVNISRQCIVAVPKSRSQYVQYPAVSVNSNISSYPTYTTNINTFTNPSNFQAIFNFLNIPVVFHVTLRPFSEVANDYTNAYTILSAKDVTYNSETHSVFQKTVINKTPDAELDTSGYVVSSISVYDNTSLPRSAVPLNYGYPAVYVNAFSSSSRDIRADRNYYGSQIFTFNLLSLLGLYQTRDTNNELISFGNCGCSPFFKPQNTRHYILSNSDFSVSTLGSGSIGRRVVVFDSEKSITDFLNSMGIPFTYSVEEAINSPVDDFTDYVPPGQPENVTGGGDGIGDNANDIMESVQPSISPYDAYSTTYLCNRAEENSISNYLWSDDFVNNVLRLWEDPGDLISSNIFFPLDLTRFNFANLGGTTEIKIGNINIVGATGNPVLSTYDRRLTTAPFYVEPYFNTFHDYPPYSKYELWLPYIGFIELSGFDIVGHNLKIEYIIGLETGECTAFIYSDDRIIAQYNGQCGTHIGLSASNQLQREVGLLNTAFAVGSGIAGAIATGGVTGALGGISAGVTAVSGITSAPQTQITRGQLGGGLNGLYAPQDAYLIVTRPKTAIAKDTINTIGYGANYGGIVSDFNGFLKCSVIEGGTSATDIENNTIKQLLEGGIYVN